MGDGAEGLVDAQSRIQDRIDELEQMRQTSRRAVVRDPERERQLESLRLARAQVVRDVAAATHAVRRQALADALLELDRRIESLNHNQ